VAGSEQRGFSGVGAVAELLLRSRTEEEEGGGAGDRASRVA